LGISWWLICWPEACLHPDVVAVVRSRGRAADLADRGVAVREAD
jgi:hypothetical protein